MARGRKHDWPCAKKTAYVQKNARVRKIKPWPICFNIWQKLKNKIHVTSFRPSGRIDGGVACVTGNCTMQIVTKDQL